MDWVSGKNPLSAAILLAAGAIATGDISRQDVRAFRRLLPYQNLFYMRRLLDAAQEGIGETIGAR